MTLIIGMIAVCAVLSLFDMGLMRKMDTGRARMLAVYSVFMLSAIVMVCVFTGLEDFSLAEILIPHK